MLNNTEDSSWISLSDLMTTLMMVFLFIALNYMIQFVEYEFAERNIYNELEIEFDKEIDDGVIRLGPNGEVSFINSKDMGKPLFKVDSDKPTVFFKDQLSNFLPKYWNIISDSLHFNFIEEIRIEGHADTTRKHHSEEENYLYNLDLSQRRAKEILAYIRTLPLYTESDIKTKNQMDFLFAAIGFSYSRTINIEGEYTYQSDNKRVENDLSRRVVFRIKTSKPELLEEIQTLKHEN